jgi:hypothetical protein
MNIKIYTKEQLETDLDMFNSTELCEIMGRNGSDKGNEDLSKSHNYTTIYYKLFKDAKYEPVNIFELGLGTNNTDVPSNMGAHGIPGASLYGWSEFFPNSKVFGADIDDRVLFETDGIKTFQCNQCDPDSIHKLWSNQQLQDIEFDILIEDGLHVHDAQICFFENSLHKVKSGGYYIIEDINHYQPFDLMCEKFQYYSDHNLYPDLEVKIYQLPVTAKRFMVNEPSDGNNGIVIIKKLNS